MASQPKTAIELLLPEFAEEVRGKINAGFLPEKAVKHVHDSHALLKNTVRLSVFKEMLRSTFPSIFPAVPGWMIREAALHFLNQPGGSEFLKDIASPVAYDMSLNALG